MDSVTASTTQQQADDFSRLFFEFTTKMDTSSTKIASFYSSFVEQKLQLAAQHIDQIANLKHLHQPLHPRPISKITTSSINHEPNSLKRRFKSSHKKHPKQVNSDFIVNDLSNDLLRLDLEFMDPISLPPSGGMGGFVSQDDDISISSPKKPSLNRQAYPHIICENNQTNQTRQSQRISQYQQEQQLQYNIQEENRKSSQIFPKQQSQQYVMINEESASKKEKKQSNFLDLPRPTSTNIVGAPKEGIRKSLLNQFSEIKVKPRSEQQSEKQKLQEQLDRIELENVRHSCVDQQPQQQQQQNEQTDSAEQAIQTLQKNTHNESTHQSESFEASSSMQEDELLFQNIGCIGDPQEGATAEQLQQQLQQQQEQQEDQEQMNHNEWEEYEMTDYSSNESSNLGSPVFAWVDKDIPVYPHKQCINEDYEALGFLQQPLKQKQMNIFETNHMIATQQQQQHQVLSDRDSFSQSTLGFGYFPSTTTSTQSQGTTSPFFARDSLMMKSAAQQLAKKDINYIPNENSMRLQSDSQQSFYQNKKLLQSPQKLKAVKQRKILYCNNKEVPSWAYDLKAVTEQVRIQNATGPNPQEIFGKFTVEYLQLVEVFKDTGKKYEEVRGSSANWRQELTPEQIENLINATSQTPNRKKQSKFTSFLQNSFNSIRKKLL